MKRPNTHKNEVAKNDPWQTISDLDCYIDHLIEVNERLRGELAFIATALNGHPCHLILERRYNWAEEFIAVLNTTKLEDNS